MFFATMAGAFVGGLTALYSYVSGCYDDIIRHRWYVLVAGFIAYLLIIAYVGFLVFCVIGKLFSLIFPLVACRGSYCG
jgi:hypothetical protein